MTRNLKALGLALVAMFAMSAVAAGGASAQDTENLFHAETEPTTITAHENTPQVFTSAAGTVTCQTIDVNVTQPKTSSDVHAYPEYTNCKVKQGETELTAHVKMNSCYYTFTVGNDITEEGQPAHHKYSGSVHIGCTTVGDKIEVRATFLGERQCLDIPPHTPTKPDVDYTNTGTGMERDVKLISTVQGITYTTTGICGAEHHTNDAEYTGEVTLTGEDAEENHMGIWVT